MIQNSPDPASVKPAPRAAALSVREGGARVLEQSQVEAKVVERGQAGPQGFVDADQVPQVGARELRAGRAVAVGVRRCRVIAKARVASLPRGRRMARGARISI